MHCLQSREGLGDAITEGYAQFYASKIFNNPNESDCSFGYYKEFLSMGGAEFPSALPVPNWHKCNTPIQWMENWCENGSARRGTEYDWMGFLMAVNVGSGVDMATVGTILGDAPGKATPVGDPTGLAIYWSAIEQTAQDKATAGDITAAQLSQFVSNSAAYGVNH